jgi:hypothetical protein
MSQKINFSDYPASGVYFIEIDNSIISSSNVQTALRMAVGFNMQGPFNRPVYIANSDECNKLFGPIDRKMERRGCWTNRNIRTMLQKSPVYVMNMLNVDTSDKESNKDTVGYTLLSLDPKIESHTTKAPYAYMYDRTRFWIADDDAFVENSFINGSEEMLNGVDDSVDVDTIEKAALFGVSNCGTRDISVIVRKSESVNGYNVTFLDYYGNQDDIPYKWINPNDYVSDYFVDVIAIAGNWDKSKYASFASDVVWSGYFSEEGLLKDKLAKFLRLDAVNVIGSWTGCILPNFTDKQGNMKSIDYLVNKNCNETGLMFGINQKALDLIALDGSTFFYDEIGDGIYNEDAGDTVANFIPDMVGHKLTTDASAPFTIMSYNIDNPTEYIKVYETVDDENIDSSTQFTLSEVDGLNVNIGDYVRAQNGLMTRIIKKRGTRTNLNDETSEIIYRFTAVDVVLGDSAQMNIEIHKSYKSMYSTLTLFALNGLKICNRHMPGYDKEGNIDPEAGVEKIYAMLNDKGIRRGLLNNDSIDFRYLVDTMAYGLGENCGGKVHLANLALDKKHCTALINAPSMTQFAQSDAPFFGDNWDKSMGDPRPTFDVAYIPQGGNQDLVYPADTKSFTLPDFENGADHVGIFAPFFKYADGQRTILVPPAADVSNTFMNKFTGGDPYKTVANMNGIINNIQIVGLEYDFDETDRGYLEPFGINPIINRNGNILIYGDRTAYQLVNSDLSFLHVRELLNTIQISCKAVLDEYVFTYNIPTTRAEIITRINPILSAMKDSGALVKYEIECDDLNNDKEVIDNKFCIVDIGVWISQNMEKIVVPITLNRSTTA